MISNSIEIISLVFKFPEKRDILRMYISCLVCCSSWLSLQYIRDRILYISILELYCPVK